MHSIFISFFLHVGATLEHLNVSVKRSPANGGKTGLIILQALGIKFPPDSMMTFGSKLSLGLRRDCIAKFIQAPNNNAAVFPPTFLSLIGIKTFRSWFNFWTLPGVSSISPVACESKNDLESSLGIVEQEMTIGRDPNVIVLKTGNF